MQRLDANWYAHWDRILYYDLLAGGPAIRLSTDLDEVAAGEETARGGAMAHADAAMANLRRGSAGNDAICEDVPDLTHEVLATAPRALAATGPGAASEPASSTPRTIRALYQAAHAHRAAAIRTLIVAAIRTVGATARRALVRARQRRQARAIYNALQQLDDRTLHDLGFYRDEIASVAAETTGQAEHTRIRVRPPLQSLAK